MPVPSCADFLAILKKKPAQVKFESCVAEQEKQGKPLRVHSSVRGQQAVQVEAARVKSFGLMRLKRSCCQ
jgi:hypothetical protein